MKIKMFSQDKRIQDPTALAEQMMISQEQRTGIRKDCQWLENRSTWRRHGWDNERHKFMQGAWLAGYLYRLGVKNIVSLGCGECYYEYAMFEAYREMAHNNLRILATDFDSWLVERMKELLPEMDLIEQFDFRKDDLHRFQGRVDAVVMINGEYLMSNEELLQFLRKFKALGSPHHLIMLSSAYLSPKMVLRYKLIPPIGYKVLRRCPGKFDGWMRSRGEFKRLVKEAELTVNRIVRGGIFEDCQMLIHIRNDTIC